MLCSECNKNPAILFYNKIEDGKETTEGYCLECAKKKGIDATEVLKKQNQAIFGNNQNISDMSKQLESLFKDLAQNINLEDIENIEGAITFGSDENDDDDIDGNSSRITGAAIPLRFNIFWWI